jgi:nucleoside-diphosphate-sugar epimerase
MKITKHAMQKSINLLITGPFGHIGSRFIREVEPKIINKILLVDNFATMRYPSLFNLPTAIKFKFIEGDILEFNFDDVLKDIDIVLHLAAITDAASSFEMEEKVMKVNFEGTKRVAEACARTNTKFILISTTSVYGTQSEIVDENCSKDELKPQSPYAKSKLLAENSLFEIATRYTSFKFVICRFGTIFGESIGMRFHTAINKFVWQSVMNEPISVWKTALHQKRPYLSLDDAVKALQFIMENDIFPNQVFNVLSLNATVNEIIAAINKYIPDTRIEFVESKIMNQLSYHVSNNKFSDLGFRFTGDLNSIINSINLLKGANFQSEIINF